MELDPKFLSRFSGMSNLTKTSVINALPTMCESDLLDVMIYAQQFAKEWNSVLAHARIIDAERNPPLPAVEIQRATKMTCGKCGKHFQYGLDEYEYAKFDPDSTDITDVSNYYMVCPGGTCEYIEPPAESAVVVNMRTRTQLAQKPGVVNSVSEKDTAIVEYLDSPLKASEIAELHGMKHIDVYSRLDSLCDRGLVVRMRSNNSIHYLRSGATSAQAHHEHAA